MGDAKRRRQLDHHSEMIHQAAIQLSKDLTDRGMLIEAGWIVYASHVLPPDVSEDQKFDMQNTFFAGASFLFDTLISIMDTGEEPTKADLTRIDNINEELTKFRETLKLQIEPAKGTS